MKKLALVLGSLLVVGTAATAKEVMPAPVVVPEKVVEIVEKPVIVYRDREVTPAWRPNGSVEVQTRFWGEIEGHKKRDNDKKEIVTEEKWDTEKGWYEKDKASDSDWDGDNLRTQLRTTANINFTENQSLKIHTRHNYGLKRDGKLNEGSSQDRIELTHTYNFGNLASSKVATRMETEFRHGKGTEKHIELRPVFDFAEYFFKNDYVKATAIEIAPFYKYEWTHNDNYVNNYGIYANFQFDLPFGLDFQAEFDDLYNYAKENANERTRSYKKAPFNIDEIDYDRTAKTGNVEITLGRTFPLYKEGKHNLSFRAEAVYETSWAYSRGANEASIEEAGTTRDLRAGEKEPRTERWGGYTAKFEPSLNYSFKATDFVTLYARVAGEYKNRNTARHEAQTWRWQPTARLGFKATF